MRISAAVVMAFALCSCGRMENVGKVPDFTPMDTTIEAQAMRQPGIDADVARLVRTPASLWSSGRHSLLGDRRAENPGDILTVVIEIDERAEISNASSRGRNARQDMEAGSLLGLPELINPILPGAGLANGADIDSSSSSSGNGTIRRNETLELKVAATVIDVLDTGVLRIQGSQEVRVNFEIRELFITGYVRPEDINRFNEITYDKIAAARISYGGRGQITDVQQPRYGQQIADIILPF